MSDLRLGFAAGVGFAAMAETGRIIPGYAPGSRLALRIIGPKAAHDGLSPKVKRQPLRRGLATAAKPTPAAKPKRRWPMTLEAKRKESKREM